MSGKGNYKKGRTHQLPGDYGRAVKALCRENPNTKARKSIKKDEETAVNRKLRCDRQYMNDQ